MVQKKYGGIFEGVIVSFSYMSAAVRVTSVVTAGEGGCIFCV